MMDTFSISAHALQQKMHRQRQLALERQRSTARKQLGAGVIASANPLLQSSGVKGAQWGTSLPDGLLSPVGKAGVLGGATPGVDVGVAAKSGAVGKETDALSELENSTQGNVPQRDISKGGTARKRNSFEDALDGLAEELLLDEKLPAVQKQIGTSPHGRNQLGPRSGTEVQKGPETSISLRADSPAVSPQGARLGSMSSSATRHSNAGWASGEANGGSAWGGAAPLQQAGPPGRANRGSVESVEEIGAFEFNAGSEAPVTSTSGPGPRRKRNQSNIGAGQSEDNIEVYGSNEKRSESPLPARPVGKSWDLSVELTQDNRSRKREEKINSGGGLGSWLFGGGSTVPTVKEEVEVTQVTAFNFD
eukprot:TRINITY_DN17236_c0_g1_i1.p1 TRINITY_DN17236_c0_g1~~TRINITY_DN17236_c0_g1_i1.p1  ORF type:complete len:363 (+),score=66.70 TRINITY_DN17236_c0_g1_i1:177-1265(+)